MYSLTAQFESVSVSVLGTISAVSRRFAKGFGRFCVSNGPDKPGWTIPEVLRPESELKDGKTVIYRGPLVKMPRKISLSTVADIREKVRDGLAQDVLSVLFAESDPAIVRAIGDVFILRQASAFLNACIRREKGLSSLGSAGTEIENAIKLSVSSGEFTDEDVAKWRALQSAYQAMGQDTSFLDSVLSAIESANSDDDASDDDDDASDDDDDASDDA